ncbi:hypothetical protein NQ315_001529 [Exocentrus adspersus]|uniref:Tubulin--tyrosine ligase-like protein 12 SET-like domain-containing protein n=1 Tax=Exocentrus adspersus TaxID=1586481 RepID=A0AAV8W8P3_9CUCU|nr:hypothetical protein NQ315_001529 [Exocentrus adspersus]
MGHDSEVAAFLNIHRDQLAASNVPKHFWAMLYNKLTRKIFDAGNILQVVRLEYDEKREEHEPVWALQALSDIDRSDPKNIYLIDHAWTYRLEKAKETLKQHEGLRQRLCSMFALDSGLETEQLVEEIFKCTWKVNNMYTIGNASQAEDRLPVWYIMDEIGSSILHSDSPNCRIVPFVYIEEQITYSLLFPIEDVEAGDFIFRDFAEGTTDPERRSAVLLPWVPKSFKHYSTHPALPGEDYFLSGHVKESLPLLSNLTSNKLVVKPPLKVFTQYELVEEYLTDNKFVIVENEEEADILWLTKHFKDFEELSNSPGKFVNQFPFEYVLTVKDLLCITCRRKDSSENWLPVTYNLLTEITNFLSCFQHRQDEGEDNYWIVKPCNLARGLDIHITDDVNAIVKLSTTLPKIAQKYITNPVLFYRPECNGKVKFDVRYVVLLKSVKPLEAYAYSNFFLRFANVPFELNEFNNYEKHFTVMNYTDTAKLKHLKCEEFKRYWQQQYGDFPWEGVEKSVVEMLKQVLESATLKEPPLGIGQSPQSRALYAADLMLEWTSQGGIQPRILEVNFMPDCKRACDYYPDFFNDVFNLLFMDVSVDTFIQL